MLHAHLGLTELADVKAEHLPDQAAQMPTRIGVVAHVGHAVRRQVRGADLENLVLNLIGHPGIHAVANDVIELAEAATDVENAERLQIDVR